MAQNASSTTDVVLVEAVNDPTTDTQVDIGSRVRWIYVEFNVAAETITNPKVIHWKLRKFPSGLSGFSAPNLYGQQDRKFTFKRGMEMLPKSVSTVYKRVFVVKVPRRYSRMDESDKFLFSYVASSAETINNCGFTIASVEV